MSPKRTDVAASSGDSKIKKFFFLRKREGEKLPDGWTSSKLPDGSELGIAPGVVLETHLKGEMSPDKVRERKKEGWAVAFSGDDQIILVRRPGSDDPKKSDEGTHRDPPPKATEIKSKPKKKRTVKNPCGFNGCKSPAHLCESLKRHHWAPPTSPPVTGGKEEEIMPTIPPATPIGGTTLDASTWLEAYKVGEDTTRHRTTAEVTMHEATAVTARQRIAAEVTMNERKFDHLDHRVTTVAETTQQRRAAVAAADARSSHGFLVTMGALGLTAALAVVAVVALGPRNTAVVVPGTTISTQAPLPPVEICGRCATTCGGGCDDGADDTNINTNDITIWVDGHDHTVVTTPENPEPPCSDCGNPPPPPPPAANRPPTISIEGLDRFTPGCDGVATVVATAVASDPDGDNVVVHWSTGQTGLSITLERGPGIHEVTAWAVDEHGASSAVDQEGFRVRHVPSDCGGNDVLGCGTGPCPSDDPNGDEDVIGCGTDEQCSTDPDVTG